MQAQINPFPTYYECQRKKLPQDCLQQIIVLTYNDSDQVPQDWRSNFKIDGKITVYNGKKKIHYLTPKQILTHIIEKDCYIDFTKKFQKQNNYLGFASQLFSNAYKFNRKHQNPKMPIIYFNKDIANSKQILSLTVARNRSKQWANGRGNAEGTPQYFEKIALSLAQKLNIKVTIIKGDFLLKQGFRLLHAVGRASKNQPTFINLAYNGNPDSDKWIAFVGKGVCFDAGGLDIKFDVEEIKLMYLDKHGACSVLSAFQQIVQQKLKINVTCSIGFVQNFLNSNSYRPSDIIKSRKGLTVEIGNTDAQGRLVLCDCMNWTQQKFKTEVLIEQSTLTGGIITALGHQYAGAFSNSKDLVQKLKQAGRQVNEQIWHMPVVEYHHDLMQHPVADVSSDPMLIQAESSQGAAFLQKFVQQGVQWVHMDIAGPSLINGQGTGYGSKILIQYAKNFVSK